MKDVIFRGKRTDNGEWVYGGVLQADNLSDISVIYDYDGSMYEPPYYEVDSYEVISETVGQYTGLKDKNGKRIFEGDVVAGALSWLEKPKNGIVKFQNGSFGLLWCRGEAEQFNPFTSMCNIEYEVIGNIHDNPELLKGECENDR